MAAEPRFCSNCRAALPDKADACPECGVFAGDLYDERMHRPRTRFMPFAMLLAAALVAGGAAIWWNAGRSLPERQPAVQRKQPPRPPGPVKDVAEALRIMRRHFVETKGLKNECVVLLSRGLSKGGYMIAAQDHCSRARLGRWRVDAKTGEVSLPRR